MSTEEIDALIERYLLLLNEYTTLQTQLNALQSSIHHNISRANFSSERGIRYGQDYYDQRMQASIRLQTSSTTTPSFAIAATDNVPISSVKDAEKVADTNDSGGKPPPVEEEKESITEELKMKAKDPLRWFGILTPQALRAAQSDASSMVQEIIPQLASKDAALKGLEIEIRRARKKFAKSNVVKGKTEPDLGTKELVNIEV